MADPAGQSGRVKQRRYRERMRARGLRPAQIWVPDTRAPGFAARCQEQVARINAASRSEQEALDLIEDAADWTDG